MAKERGPRTEFWRWLQGEMRAAGVSRADLIRGMVDRSGYLSPSASSMHLARWARGERTPPEPVIDVVADVLGMNREVLRERAGRGSGALSVGDLSERQRELVDKIRGHELSDRALRAIGATVDFYIADERAAYDDGDDDGGMPSAGDSSTS